MFEIPGFAGGETEAAIIIGVAQHKDDLLAFGAQVLQTGSDEGRADALSLMFRPDGHRRQSDGRDWKTGWVNPHPAEQDVSDCLGGALRYEG